MKEKRIYISIIALLLIGIILSPTVNSIENNETNNNSDILNQPKNCRPSEIWDFYYERCLEPKTCVGDTCLLPSRFERELPEMPEDFYPVKTLLYTGQLPNFCENVGEEYWKQPDMYPNWEESGIPRMIKLERGAQPEDGGYGSFPVEYVVNIKPGETVYTCNYWMTTPGLATTHALSVVPHFPESAKLYDNDFSDKTRTIDGSAREYFDVEVFPKEVVLGHTWPYFQKNWTRKITYKITAKSDTPPGKYIITFDVGPVSKETYEKLIYEKLTMLWAVGYTGTGFGFERPYLTLGLEVEPTTDLKTIESLETTEPTFREADPMLILGVVVIIVIIAGVVFYTRSKQYPIRDRNK